MSDETPLERAVEALARQLDECLDEWSNAPHDTDPFGEIRRIARDLHAITNNPVTEQLTYTEWMDRYLTGYAVSTRIDPEDSQQQISVFTFDGGALGTFAQTWHHPKFKVPTFTFVLDSMCGDFADITERFEEWEHGFDNLSEAMRKAITLRRRVTSVVGEKGYRALMEATE